MPTTISPIVSQGSVLNGLGWPGRRSPQTGMASTAAPMTGVTTQSHTFLGIPLRRNLTHSTTSATFAIRYMMISPRIPQVPRKLDAVPGLVNAVEITPIRMLGATKATAATAGVLNRGLTLASALVSSPPRAPAKMTREVCVLAATYELVTLDRNIQVISGATNGRNALAAVWKGLVSLASVVAWPTPNAVTSA